MVWECVDLEEVLMWELEEVQPRLFKVSVALF